MLDRSLVLGQAIVLERDHGMLAPNMYLGLKIEIGHHGWKDHDVWRLGIGPELTDMPATRRTPRPGRAFGFGIGRQ